MPDSDSNKRHPNFKDLTGRRFGRLTVTSYSRTQRTSKTAYNAVWLCRCDCGIEKLVLSPHLLKALVLSCGCLSREHASKLNHKHGFSGKRHPQRYIYELWHGIKDRCYNPKDISYPTYGGWGITMEPEWRDNFESFVSYILSVLGDRPTKQHSIDRIVNAKGYSKGNLKWSTPSEQNRNKTTTRLITAGGRTQCLTDWANEIGRKPRTISIRIDKLGWTEEEAVEVIQRTKRD